MSDIPILRLTGIAKSFGAGLGLATVKQIVVQHGGRISIESELGRGTRVSVRLPLGQTLRAAA